MTSRNSTLQRSRLTTLAAVAVLAVATTATALTSPADARPATAGPELRGGERVDGAPVVIGHRGASGYRPEHTLEAYRLAIAMGADLVEPDLVSTKDGVLVARHENEISGTTDVADRPEFADRRTTKLVDGVPVTGWFTEDFTLAELRTLRAVERLPEVRPASAQYDGLFQVPTFEQVLDLVRRESRRTGRTIGVYPETKHPTYFDSIGLSLEEPLVAALRRHGLDRRDAPVVVQSFETANLRDLDAMTRVDLVQLVGGSGAPYDVVAAGGTTTYADLVTAAGLQAVAEYADGVGPEKGRVLPRRADGSVGEPTRLVADAHAAGLLVHVYTLRQENRFMATDFRRGVDPDAPGDLAAEVRAFLDAGVDGFFTDHPDVAVAARDAWLRQQG